MGYPWDMEFTHVTVSMRLCDTREILEGWCVCKSYWLNVPTTVVWGNGGYQLAIGVRLASRYPIQVDDPEGPSVQKGPTGFENQSPWSFFPAITKSRTKSSAQFGDVFADAKITESVQHVYKNVCKQCLVQMVFWWVPHYEPHWSVWVVIQVPIAFMCAFNEIIFSMDKMFFVSILCGGSQEDCSKPRLEAKLDYNATLLQRTASSATGPPPFGFIILKPQTGCDQWMVPVYQF